MTEQEFLQHHNLLRNPFSDEDAQTDAVFREHCISGTFHPSWSKVVGDAKQPATSIVFGPKGSGKTAIRLQLKQHIKDHNRNEPQHRVYLVELDDFNSYLGPLQRGLSRRIQANPDKVLQSVHLWDHMDAILCEAITPLVDGLLGTSSQLNAEAVTIDPAHLSRLDRGQRRDLLLLTAVYDLSPTGTHADRFYAVKKKLGFRSLSTWWPVVLGIVLTLVTLGLVGSLYWQESLSLKWTAIMAAIGLAVSWGAYSYRWVRYHMLASRICRHLRVIPRDKSQLRNLLLCFSRKELDEQPLPVSDRSDDRYAILEKLQLLLRSIGYPGMIVIVDRVDEPDLINGLAERMKLLVWPLLDNKLLKHENLGIKLLLPSDLQYYIDRETREFHERARLDKQNVVPGFDWTGEALYDLLGARMKACGVAGAGPSPKSLFDPQVTDARLIAAFQSLKTPRNLFRFLYRLISEHCKRYRSEHPEFKITNDLFETTLAIVQAEEKRG
jgi:hypothetical protein